MSIVPRNSQQNNTNQDVWDPAEDLLTWDPFLFPSLFPTLPFPSLFNSNRTHVNCNWTETRAAHVLRVAGFQSQDVLFYIDDDDMMQISTEDGRFVSKFKMPDDGVRDQIQTFVRNGVLTIVVPKEGSGGGVGRPGNVRVVEITGSD